jgi:tRNA threonylcarbamoyl adenosine modification protein (Sua5/YciO/YrdC/YwlC family)
VTRFVASDDPTALDAAEAVLRAGEAMVLPTDTVYGLAALPTSIEALYALKGRPESMPIAVLVESLDQAASLVSVDGSGGRVARTFWPGPLTLVLRRLDGEGTLGVRCPDDAFIHLLAQRVGPLAVTSANRHGEATPVGAGDAAASLTADVALVVDGGPCHGEPSTVVDATGPHLTIIRAGPITEEQIQAAALR